MRTSYRQTNTTDPVLSRIQDAVASAFRDTDSFKSEVLTFSENREATIQVRLNEAVVVKGPSTVLVALPEATQATKNQRCAVARTETSRAITASSPNSNINGGTSYVLPSVAGMYTFYSTGSEWVVG